MLMAPVPCYNSPISLMPNIRFKGSIRIKQGNGQEETHFHFDPIPVSYTHLLPYLIHSEAVVPTKLKPTTFPYPPKHDPNSKYAYHTRYEVHSTKDDIMFKIRVQELIDQKILNFTEEKPNVKTNPLPSHNGPTVNAIEESKHFAVVKK